MPASLLGVHLSRACLHLLGTCIFLRRASLLGVYLSHACISLRHVSLSRVHLSQTCISHRRTSRTGMYLLWACISQACISHRRVSHTGVYLIRVCILHSRASHTAVHLIAVHLIGMHLIAVYLTAVHLISVHLIDVYLTAVHLTWCRPHRHAPHGRTESVIFAVRSQFCEMRLKSIQGHDGYNRWLTMEGFIVLQAIVRATQAVMPGPTSLGLCCLYVLLRALFANVSSRNTGSIQCGRGGTGRGCNGGASMT